jgi:PAS domain S-box-containing protein
MSSPSPEDALPESPPRQDPAAAAPRALAATSAELAAILEMIGDGFVAFDADLNYTYVNARAAAILGRTDLVGKNYRVEYPEAQGTPFAQAYERALANREALQFESHYAPWDRWFENRIYPTAGGGLAVFFTEITDRKRVEATIAASEARLALVFDTVGDVLFLLRVEEGERYRFESVNPAFLAVTGLRAEQVVGKLIEEVLPPTAHAFVRDKYAEAVRSRATVRWEEVSAYPTGTLYGEVAVTPAHDPSGACTHLIGSVHDVTEARRAAAEVAQLNLELERRVAERTAQLEAANRELESFSYSVSHDLRAPLRAVSGFAEIIARRHRASLPAEGQRYFDNIVLASERMARLIDELLNYSRLGRGGVRHDRLPLGEVLGPLVTDLAPRLEKSGARLTVAPDLPAVSGDRVLLGQVFSNLLDNALTYHAAGVAAVVRVDAERSGDRVVVRVRDNGIGIPAEHHGKIFKIFQRLHSDDAFPGTGIGLASVRKSVEMLGGHVWVESQPGEGATFLVELPAA